MMKLSKGKDGIEEMRRAYAVRWAGIRKLRKLVWGGSGIATTGRM